MGAGRRSVGGGGVFVLLFDPRWLWMAETTIGECATRSSGVGVAGCALLVLLDSRDGEDAVVTVLLLVLVW